VSATSPLWRYLLDPGSATRAVLEHVLAALHAALPYLALALGLCFVAVVTSKVLRRSQQRRMAHDARFISVLAPPDPDMAGAGVLWSNMVALLRPGWLRVLMGQPHLSFEYRWSVAGLRIGIWVPGCVPPGMVERAVEAAWPGALTTAFAPEAPFPEDDAAAGGTLRLARSEWLPLNTDHEVDALRPLLGAASELSDGECAVVQVLARPAAGRRVARLFRAAEAVRSGRSVSRLAWALNLFLLRPQSAATKILDLAAAQDARLILGKAAAPQYEVVVRYAVSSAHRSRDTRRILRGRAHGIASAFAAYTRRNRLARHRLHAPARVLAQRRLVRGDLLSVSELTMLAHLPTDRVIPGLVRAGARSVAPPPGAPLDGKVLGDSEGGRARPVALDAADARYHLHVMGATGTGKSTLLTNLILGDVAAGRGVVAIDPKGDLVTDILARLPEDAADRLVLLDAEESVAPPTLNVLEGTDADLVVDNVVGIFHRIFENFWGPRTDDVLRAACLTLLEGKVGATLTDVPKLLNDATFRRQCLRAVKIPVLRGFWSWYEAMGDGQRSQLIGPLMNKLRAFLLRDFVRRVVGSSQSSFDMGKDVLNGGICLVRIPKGVLGEETARLLGSFVVASVWQAVTARARQGEETRADAAVYIDECQNFLTLPRSFDEMLAEARGYRLSLVLAHQHLGQLPVSLREAISANARSKVFFALSPEDARALERHVTPELSAHDLSHLGGYQAAARLVVSGTEAPAFTLRTRPATAPVAGRAEYLRAASREKFGRGEPPPDIHEKGRTPQRMGAATRGIRRGIPSGVRPTSLPVEQPSDALTCS